MMPYTGFGLSISNQVSFIIPAFFLKKKGYYVLSFGVHPSLCLSIRPSGKSLPASSSILLMLETPNLYA